MCIRVCVLRRADKKLKRVEYVVRSDGSRKRSRGQETE